MSRQQVHTNYVKAAGSIVARFSLFRVRLKKFAMSCPKIYWAIRMARYGIDGCSIEYDLIVDGFPRSANTFLAHYLSLSNPGLNIKSHVHAIPYVVLAARSQKPACIVIRDPIDAIASWVIYTSIPIKTIAAEYLLYYSVASSIVDKVVIASFDTIIKNPVKIASALNKKFELKLDESVFSEEKRLKVIKSVQAVEWGKELHKRSLPTQERDEFGHYLKNELRRRSEYKSLVQKCEKIYQQVRVGSI